MTEKTFVVGGSPDRLDAWDKVTGRTKYVADVATPDLCHGAILRSPHLHAEIMSIDTSAARRMPGVIAVIIHSDIPGEKIYGDILPDRPVLAFDRVRFIGEPVAIVVADSRAAAERARDAVRVEYRPLPAVIDPLQAAQPDAVRIHPNGNVLCHFKIDKGDAAAAMQQAELVLEETFQVPRTAPAYLEPETARAVYHPDGKISIWVSSQHPFIDGQLAARVLNLPVEKIRVHSGAIGGAFGGKEDANLPILAALSAFATQRAVRLVNTREESMLAHPKRHSGSLHYRLGALPDGTITSLQVTSYLDTGAYASYGPAVAQLFTEVTAGAYHIPNVTTETFLVYTNAPIAGAMRGFGAPQANFAVESLMDILAYRLGMDPVEVRRKNAWRDGDTNLTRVRVNQAGSTQVSLETAAQEMQRLRAIPATAGKKAGVGMALVLQTMGLGWGVPDDSANRLEWQADGRVLLRIGAPDLGQGLNTAAAQVAAEALGIDLSRVEVAPIDTDISPNGGVTCASRTTYMVSNSVLLAADELVRSLKTEGARLLGTSADKLAYRNGALLRLDRAGEAPIPAAEISARLAEAGIPVQGSATFSFPYPADTPQEFGVGMPHVLFCLGAHVARVEVDAELGTLQVTHVSAIHDVGKVLNRKAVEGQVEGGVVMALGFALSEDMLMKSNGAWVTGFSEYLLPTAMDIPLEIKTILLEQPESSGPYGAKGIGEATTTATAAAVANAVFQASGVRVTRAPISSERFWEGR